VFAGLRISEALALRWRDVDLAGGRLRVDDSKTDAGSRWVPIAPALRSELVARKLSTRFSDVDDLVFTTIAGRKLSRDNTRTRILGKAIELADETLIAADLTPLPEKLTQHSLRHTYISLRVALGDDLAAVSRDAGHADTNVTFRIYTHVMSLGEGDRARLRALVDGGVCAPLSSSGTTAPVAPDATSPRNDENPHEQEAFGGSWGGTRTPDLTIMSRAL
jgi:integrase